MERFETAWENIVTGVIGLATVAGVFWIAYQQTSLETVLAGSAAALGGVVVYLVHNLHGDLDERIEGIETKVDVGFTESLSSLEDANVDEYPTRTDGSGWREVRGVQVDKVEFSGIPSVAGAAVGGAIGALFGPAGAGAGALIGAAAGGGKEYQDLKERHQERLERAAWIAVQKESPAGGWDLMLSEIRDATGATDDYWVFVFSEDSRREYQVRISKSDGTVEYRPGQD